MAAALSRALKLPGKKGSELGEYDPLTQADSDDESEEDDLVLNYPRNGLGRDTCLGTAPSKLRGSRSARIRAKDGTQEEEEDEEEDEWREQLPSKSRQDRGDMKGMQYWSHRESSRDRMGGGGAGSLGGAGLGVHSTDLELKRLRMKNVIRSAFFLVPVVCATVLVLLCAFLIPCRKGEMERKPQWERALGDAGGLTPHALALWDVDGDSVEDVLLGVTEWTNDTHPTQRNKLHSVVVLSAASGRMLWRKPMAEPVMYVQCGLQHGSQRPAACLLISKSLLMAVNSSTGKNLSSVQLKNIESQAVLLPDVQGDGVPDLLIATLPADEALDLSLSLISGLTGEQIGRPVPFHLFGQGKLTGPLLHQTEKGAYYILFGLGSVEAISLRDIYTRATDKAQLSPALKVKDSLWEKLKNTSTSFVHIYRGSEGVEFLLPFVAGFGNNHNNLDPVSNLNTTRSDWVLVYGSSSSKLSVIKQKDIHKTWTWTSSKLIQSQPSLGHFNDDGVLDLFFQHSSNGVMEAQVIDGANGQPLWSAQFVCPHLVLETSAISTTTGQSVFLFWASHPIRTQKNGTRTTVAPGVAAAEPFIRNLFLLHPAYPTILLQLSSTTDTAVTSAVSYQEHQKDATYVTVSSRPTTDSEFGAHIVKSMSLRSAIAKGQIVIVGESNKPGGPVKPGVFEVNKFFSRLTFRPQVSRGGTNRGAPARLKATGRSALQRH
ncbi:protein FAM234B isoform X3 [Betta splendens]|uniref:Protein FAM234B isoform X3 n=1 Tax=Betta splendens TaxID=158456 RepID=A0A6P7N4Q2_BETSP|nr:protein FAM234B isoform X3 [Betta splendens]